MVAYNHYQKHVAHDVEVDWLLLTYKVSSKLSSLLVHHK